MHHKVIIIGSGPAGYTAALYAARANLEPLVFEGFFSGPAGGQLMTTTDVENFPGFPQGITGPALMDAFRQQCERFGTKLLQQDVKSVDLSSRPFKVEAKESHTADSIIIATGATAKRLEIDGAGEDGFWQRGVTACAVCDGAMPIFRDKELYVIGGGDSAVEEAIFLTKYGSKVYLVHRRDELRASKIMAERAKSHPKVEILWDSVITKIDGEKTVGSVTLENLKTKKSEVREAAGVFFAIGHKPNTDFLNGQLKTDEQGYLLVKPGTTYTDIEGVFAAGDVQDPVYRQAVSAAGSGCMAAIDAERWLGAQGIE
ncbi:MAG: Thioredoxin reductase [Chlamydiales bacterium]|nr:Thioredoxin reductase [Chlamydiales bacterium]MCH9634821.1 Thioredoxin reductase [Chlamydiales bacterium]